ncbi:uncharacterized protein [Malus domestica]|uniref:uncharacterized protein n=1 Tax=Malus domestica TaxID=3750 RepID=UPI003974797D
MERVQKWQKPYSGWIKCNFDAAWDDIKSRGGIGIMVRNSDGEFIASMVVWENGIRSALHVEAAAMHASSVFKRQWSIEQVQVEGDALLVISAIQNEGTAHHGPYGHLFADTQQILQSFKIVDNGLVSDSVLLLEADADEDAESVCLSYDFLWDLREKTFFAVDISQVDDM